MNLENMQVFLAEFKKTYTAADIIKTIKNFRGMRVLIIGEAILDEYNYVSPMGKPQKGNHLAAKDLDRQEVHAGGVLACANHVANFCGHVDLVTVIGQNKDSEKLIRSKIDPNINPIFFFQKKTIVKARYIDDSYRNKVFELYKNEEPPSEDVSRDIFNWLGDNLKLNKYDLVLALDYGHGLFDQKIIRFICELAPFLAVNAQANTSNYGYNLITKYLKANYFCLDESELRLAYHDRYCQDIKPLLVKLGEATSIPGIVNVTRGHKGAMIYNSYQNKFFEVPVFSGLRKVVDTIGAGDAFLALSSLCAARKLPIELTAFVGNAAGAIAVGYLGNQYSVEADELYEFIGTLLE